MNAKPGGRQPSQNKPAVAIEFRGGSYTIQEAGALASQEQTHGKPQAALEIYDLILAKMPGYADVHINRGVTLHALSRYEEALASFDKAVALRPNYAEAYSDRSVTLHARRMYGDALASCDKAIALKPDCAEAHINRGVTLYALKRYEEALASYDQALALKPDRANAYYSQGAALHALKRYEEALTSYDKALALQPGCAEAHNNRGVTLHALKRHGEALASYIKAIAFQPDYAEAYNNRGVTLHALKRYEEALASYDKAIALKPNYAGAHNNRGATLQTLKRYDDALASCDRAVALRPDYAEAWNNRGLYLVNKGDMPEAEKMCLKALALQSDSPDPWFTLVNIRHYQDANHADIKRVEGLLQKPGVSPDDREQLYFCLGKMYDDCGLYDEAFEYYRQANQIRNTTVSYDSGKMAASTDSTMEVFSEEFLAQPVAGASDSRAPLFIVGMPRSGTTLLANILSNHRDVATAGELPTIIELTGRLKELVGGGISYPQAVRHITPTIASRLAEDYEKRLRRDAGATVPRVIDKHPLNFRHLGYIATLFPKSQIIHCIRDPLDVGLSNYFQRFTTDYDYSFDLRNIGHFYGEYARLMEHWRKALPRKMIEVRYEDMVANTEAVVRQTLGELGLDWDERCLAPHTNPCAVETASQWQVRRPIYQQSVGRWRHYDKHLPPLKEALAMAQLISVG